MVVAGGAGAAAGADAGAAASDAMNVELTEAGAQKIAVLKL